MTREDYLSLLQLLYQGLNLITKGIKREIDRLKQAQIAPPDNSSSL